MLQRAFLLCYQINQKLNNSPWRLIKILKCSFSSWSQFWILLSKYVQRMIFHLSLTCLRQNPWNVSFQHLLYIYKTINNFLINVTTSCYISRWTISRNVDNILFKISLNAPACSKCNLFFTGVISLWICKVNRFNFLYSILWTLPWI